MTNGALNRYVRSQLSPGADGVIEGALAVGVKYPTTDHFGLFRGPHVQKGPGIGVPVPGVIFQNTNAIVNSGTHTRSDSTFEDSC